MDTNNMTKHIIPNNSLYVFNSAKPSSHTIKDIQPLSLSCPPILTKPLYYIIHKFPTTQPEKVYTTIPTSVSPSHDNHNSKLANEIRTIPNLLNQ